jgi:acyl carrier protein
MPAPHTPAAKDQFNQLTDYIARVVIRRSGVEINEDTPLITSGLIDSIALIEIFLQLEQITNRKIPASKVRTQDMDTVRLMFEMAEKLGKPRSIEQREPHTRPHPFPEIRESSG